VQITDHGNIQVGVCKGNYLKILKHLITTTPQMYSRFVRKLSHFRHKVGFRANLD
jgi:hypothetical protein